MVQTCYSLSSPSHGLLATRPLRVQRATVAGQAVSFITATMKTFCATCRKAILKSPSKIRSRNYCSIKCMMLWLAKLAKKRVGVKHQGWVGRIKRKCAVCRITVKVYPARAKANRRVICSPECNRKYAAKLCSKRSGSHNPNWLGGRRSYRGPNWEVVRKQILNRDGNRCVHCNAETRLSVHHIKPFRLFKSYKAANREKNLKTLCAWCHGIAESLFWKRHSQLKVGLLKL